MDSLDGSWQPVYAEFDGEEAPKVMLGRMELELAAGSYTVRFGGVVADQGTHRVDEDGLTLIGTAGPNAGRTIPCLHKLADGVLSICYGLGGVRPTRFATERGSRHYLANYRRKAG